MSTPKSRGSSLVRSIAISASILMACACSTGPALPPTALQASIPAHLLVKPSPAPEIPRSTDPQTGEQKIDGAQAMTGIASLYDYVGAVKGQLEALIDAVAARDAQPPKKRKRHLF